jgi:hypothetical protein
MNSTKSRDDEAYREFARKMQLFEDGPTTTPLQELAAIGIEVPAPEAIDDDRLSGRPDEDAGDDHPMIDVGQSSIRLWWD